MEPKHFYFYVFFLVWIYLDICRLIKYKVDMDKRNPGNQDGSTPLHLASSQGHEEICRLIMERVDDKNPADNRGRTPLHEAARRDHKDVCGMIIDSASVADKNPVNDDGWCPLNLAEWWGGNSVGGTAHLIRTKLDEYEQEYYSLYCIMNKTTHTHYQKL